ncbi:hypothetical protein LI90_339 [Carbonactinospora thermoautotrophica]|uniref:Uncharacterized protein n=1 Tax=Carbonactinospora thermoautotrophica TaxID=1469144 RepID=A0A132MLH1_9ACTN|nr:hypothetical protein LI90_339 [Carbonactinospora thermoautotrophica]
MPRRTRRGSTPGWATAPTLHSDGVGLTESINPNGSGKFVIIP